MDHRRKKDIDMPRAHQQTQVLWDEVLVRKIDAHVSPGNNKDDKYENAKY